MVTSFINAGGNLFLSGSEIGWDLDQQNNGRTFYETTLKGNYVSDDAGTYTATANAGGIFTGMSSFVFSDGASFTSLDTQTYNVAYPDVIAPQPGAASALTYSGGTGGTAAIQVQGTGGAGNIVMFGFPFETITTAANRAAVMDRVSGFLLSERRLQRQRHGRWRRLCGVAQQQRHERAADHTGRRERRRPGEPNRLLDLAVAVRHDAGGAWCGIGRRRGIGRVRALGIRGGPAGCGDCRFSPVERARVAAA